MEEPDGSPPDPASSDGHPDHPDHPDHQSPGTAPFLPDAWWGLTLIRRREVAGVLALVVLAIVGAGLFLLLAGGSDDSAGGPTTATVDPAAFVAALPPARVDTWNSLAQCESSSDWSDDTGNGFYGGLQFTLDSWQTVGGAGNPADASKNEQIMRAEYLQQDQGWTAWPDCAAQLGLT